jgi:hypothetical protein
MMTNPRKLIDEGRAGETVGLELHGISRDAVECGDVVRGQVRCACCAGRGCMRLLLLHAAPPTQRTEPKVGLGWKWWQVFLARYALALAAPFVSLTAGPLMWSLDRLPCLTASGVQAGQHQAAQVVGWASCPDYRIPRSSVHARHPLPAHYNAKFHPLPAHYNAKGHSARPLQCQRPPSAPPTVVPCFCLEF